MHTHTMVVVSVELKISHALTILDVLGDMSDPQLPLTIEERGEY